jgi:hypothetical protein
MPKKKSTTPEKQASREAQEAVAQPVAQPGSEVEALRQEYGTALEKGGVEGRIRALAVAKVCEGTGISLDQVVEPYRKQTHHNAIETAQRLEAALRTLPGERSLAAYLKHNPFDGVEDRRRRIGTYTATRKGMRVGSNGPLFPNQRRKRLWK